MSQLTARDFQRPAHKEFYKTLSAVDPSGGIGFYKLFEDFLTLAACSIYQGAIKAITGKTSDDVEADYMQTVGHYDRERAKGFSEAFAILTLGLEQELHDFLGDVYSCSGISNHWAGQFFTPWPICEALAMITLGEPKPSQKRLTVCEPAVGGGAMLLSVAKHLKTAGFAPWHWWFDATDVDRRCFHMAYIQLSLAAAPGVVRHGNSISLEQWNAWPTPMAAFFPHVMKRSAPIEPQKHLPPIGGQYDLDLAA